MLPNASHRGSPVPNEWRRWAAESKLSGVGAADIRARLEQHGFDAGGELAALESHPYLEGADWMAQRVRQLESILRVEEARTPRRWGAAGGPRPGTGVARGDAPPAGRLVLVRTGGHDHAAPSRHGEHPLLAGLRPQDVPAVSAGADAIALQRPESLQRGRRGGAGPRALSALRA